MQAGIERERLMWGREFGRGRKERDAAKGEMGQGFPPPHPEMGRDAPAWERAPSIPLCPSIPLHGRGSLLSPLLHVFFLSTRVLKPLPQPSQAPGGECIPRLRGSQSSPSASKDGLPPTKTHPKHTVFLLDPPQRHHEHAGLPVFFGLNNTEKIKEMQKCGPASAGTSAACVGEVAPRGRIIRQRSTGEHGRGKHLFPLIWDKLCRVNASSRAARRPVLLHPLTINQPLLHACFAPYLCAFVTDGFF